ncbi:alpha/beta hydrolase [Dokdonella sp.]|uniref:alpha/beta fold hydrolase n=1 Tax=Dokdonella sp. TaxID=2291710 RepID=UPI001B1066EB|nr:alpha/beta hydrolase [Dokdonella sp.]MBO9663324.1 alpha/beta hydrolase [Dokdonella sp.]
MRITRTLVVLAPLIVAGLVSYTWWSARQAEAQVPPLGQFVDVGGMRLHYVDRGQGPVIVMVHGLSGNLRNFHALIDRLAKDHRVIAVDRPDCGYSTRLSGKHPDLFAQAAVLAEFMRTLDLRRPLLVGHSLGGALSLALALDHPEAVSGLVLIAPASGAIVDPPAVFKDLDLTSPLARELVAWTLATLIGKLKHEAMLRDVFAPEPVPANFDVDGGGALAARPLEFVTASQDMVGLRYELPTMVPRYAALTLPVDVVFGRQDPLLDYKLHGERLAAAIPGARLHLLEGGHMLPVTQADTVAALIAQAAEKPLATTAVAVSGTR